MGDRSNFRYGNSDAFRSPRNFRFPGFRRIGRLDLFREIGCSDTTPRLDCRTGYTGVETAKDGLGRPRISGNVGTAKVKSQLYPRLDGFRIFVKVQLVANVLADTLHSVIVPEYQPEDLVNSFFPADVEK